MRIVYFAHVNGGNRSGVFHKIAGQVGRWRTEGRSVRLCVATRDDVAPWETSFSDAIIRRYDGLASRLRAMTALVLATREFAPDIIYVRWDLFYPPMLAFPSSAAIVVEVNSDDMREYALGSLLRSQYNDRTRSIILGRARALVFVTSELSNGRSFGGYGGIRKIITNGIDLDSYPELPAHPTQQPRLVFVGSAGQPWHGVDKLLTLADLRPAWRFDIVGMRGSASSPNVTWHGSLDRTNVLRILEHADVGIGTLALHRKSMAEACSLKLREYLAVGLPVFYGHKDLDVDRLGSYVLRIANTESNVVDALDRIDEFVDRSRGERVPRSEVAHIDVARKEEQRLALFDEIAGV